MKIHFPKIGLLLSCLVAATACQNKELGELGYRSTSVQVRINWEVGQPVITGNGMRINLFSTDENVPHYGMADIPHTGAKVLLRDGTSYSSYAYTYQGNNIYFRNQQDPDLIEAYSTPMTRATYSSAYPEETTISEVSGEFYVGENVRYAVIPELGEQYIDLYPVNKLYTYTFEVRNVKGAAFISAVRGAISGMSSSYFLATHLLNNSPFTLLFNASVEVSTERIIGSFHTFGRLDATNRFSIEILYPSDTEGIVLYTWDVTAQIKDGLNYHIVIDDSGIIVPDEGGEGASNWNVSVDKWEDVTVPLQ